MNRKIVSKEEMPSFSNFKTDRVRKSMKDERFFQDLAETFKALSDPTRTKIIFALCMEDKLCVHEIAEIAETTSSAVSHQLRLLRSLRLVKYFKTGRIAYYSLDDIHINNLFAEGSRHVEEKQIIY
jgi:DNA-binding transcriptional ArsR family regulator